jgi:GT2 family glycosyltransferase
MSHEQPSDEWTFLRPDEFVDDDAVERADQAAERQPEEQAMHVSPIDRLPANDPGRADVDTGTPSGDDADERSTVSYFDDEEPEWTSEDERPPTVEHEPDLEEILESQHYTFPPTER